MYSAERGYASAASFAFSETLVVFSNDIEAHEKYAEEITDSLWRVIVDRAVTAILLSHARRADMYIAKWMTPQIAVHRMGVLEWLGLNWIGLREGERTERYDIFGERILFSSTMPDRVIGLIDHVRDEHGERRYVPPSACLATELLDNDAWWLVLVPQAIALGVLSADEVSQEEARQLAAAVMDTSGFQVGLH
jgi:hypothetical protein